MKTNMKIKMKDKEKQKRKITSEVMDVNGSIGSVSNKDSATLATRGVHFQRPYPRKASVRLNKLA